MKLLVFTLALLASAAQAAPIHSALVGKLKMAVGADVSQPVLVNQKVIGSTVTLVFSEPVTGTSTYLNDFKFNMAVAGSNVGVSSQISGNGTSVWELQLATAAVAGETVVLFYTDGSRVADNAGNYRGNINDLPVANFTGSPAGPIVTNIRMWANGQLYIYFSEPIIASGNLLPYFRMSGSVSGANRTPNVSYSVSSNAVRFTFDVPAVSGETLTLTYTGTTSITNSTGQQLSAFSNKPVVNDYVNAPDIASASATGSTLTVVFNKPVLGAAGFLSDFNVDMSVTGNNIATSSLQAYNGLTGNGTNTWKFNLASPSVYGETLTLDYVNSSRVTAVTGGAELPSKTAVVVTNANPAPDTTPPTLVSAAVSGNNLVLTFSEPVTGTSTYLADINVDMSTTGSNIAMGSQLSGNGSATWNLLLATSAANGETVDLDYISAARIKDLAGNNLASITDRSVTNSTSLFDKTGLVVWMDLNGTLVNQANPGVYNATANGAGFGYMTDKWGTASGALKLASASPSNAYIPGNTGLNPSGSFTWMFWMKDDVVSTGTQVLVSRYSVASGNYQFQLKRQGGANDRFITVLSSDGTTGVSKNGANGSYVGENDRAWHHYAFTFDSATSTGVLYVDGSSVFSGVWTGQTAVYGADATTPLVFGNADTGAGGVMDGGIASFSLWHRKLSSGEVTSIYASGTRIKFSDL